MTCRKCKSTSILTTYDRAIDALRRHCRECGYEWNDPPADREKTTADFLKDREARV